MTPNQMCLKWFLGLSFGPYKSPYQNILIKHCEKVAIGLFGGKQSFRFKANCMTANYENCCRTPKGNSQLSVGAEFRPMESIQELPTCPKSAFLDADPEVTKGNCLETWTASRGRSPAGSMWGTGVPAGRADVSWALKDRLYHPVSFQLETQHTAANEVLPAKPNWKTVKQLVQRKEALGQRQHTWTKVSLPPRP